MIFLVDKKSRLDIFLAQQILWSRSKIQKIINSNCIKIDQKFINKASFIVEKGQKVEILDSIFASNKKEESNFDLEIEIIYEDQYLMVINKPNNLIVHPTNNNKDKTLINALINKNKPLSNINIERPGIVHRLDKNTTGVMLIAKTNSIHQELAKQFELREIKKVYYAIVVGALKNKVYHLNLPIGLNPKNRSQKKVTNKDGKHAITHVYLEKIINNTYSLVKCIPETGRTHQIRVHLAYINYPILGDEIYHKPYDNLGQRLHSYSLTFFHPIIKKELTFFAPLGEKFNMIINKENDKNI